MRAREEREQQVQEVPPQSRVELERRREGRHKVALEDLGGGLDELEDDAVGKGIHVEPVGRERLVVEGAARDPKDGAELPRKRVATLDLDRRLEPVDEDAAGRELDEGEEDADNVAEARAQGRPGRFVGLVEDAAA